ncbi:hypothetical protein JCM8097_004342 [Rhodosporidiobolus ruineniae]
MLRRWFAGTRALLSKMTMQQPSLLPPIHRGMSQLDRDAFRTTLPLLAARLPANNTTQFLKHDGKDFVLRLRGIGAVVPDPSDQHRRILLRTGDRSQIPQECLDVLKQHNGELVESSVSVGYDYWTSDQVLQAILPEELLDESPTAFTQVGHIAHLNLRDQYLPHRHLIGQVILDKNKSLRTVVNKLDSIDNVYRNFQMEVLAGDHDFMVEMAEHDCRFRFDFSKVYWNSRLQTEHARLVSLFKPDDVVVDGFAGVGPFAIPAGKKGCGVLASDLNPASAEALKGNAALNRVEKTVRTSNEDGRDFIKRSVLAIWDEPFPVYEAPLSARERAKKARQAMKEREAAKAAAAAAGGEASSSSSPAPPASADASATPDLSTVSLSSSSSSPAPPASESPKPQRLRRLPSHYVMNLPASALTFLDAFDGLFRDLYAREGEETVKKALEEETGGRLPVVHCYCFTKEPEGEAATKDICERATAALGHRVHTGLPDFNLHYVRDVAPKKIMFCLEFRLTDEMVR